MASPNKCAVYWLISNRSEVRLFLKCGLFFRQHGLCHMVCVCKKSKPAPRIGRLYFAWNKFGTNLNITHNKKELALTNPLCPDHQQFGNPTAIGRERARLADRDKRKRHFSLHHFHTIVRTLEYGFLCWPHPRYACRCPNFETRIFKRLTTDSGHIFFS